MLSSLELSSSLDVDPPEVEEPVSESLWLEEEEVDIAFEGG